MNESVKDFNKVSAKPCNTTALEYIQKAASIPAKELQPIIFSILVDCETFEYQETKIDHYKNIIYGRIERATKSGENMPTIESRNPAPTLYFAYLMMQNGLSEKYNIVKYYIFESKKEIWAISNNTIDASLNEKFDEEVFYLGKKEHLEVYPMLLSDKDINYNELPKFDERLEVPHGKH